MTADTIQMLTALDDLEKLSLSYAFELSYLSKRIRMDIWEPDKNSKQLAVCLDTINKVFRTMKLDQVGSSHRQQKHFCTRPISPEQGSKDGRSAY